MDNYEMSVWMRIKALADVLLLRSTVLVLWLPGTWIFNFMSRLSEVLLFVLSSCEQDLFHVPFACGASTF